MLFGGAFAAGLFRALSRVGSRLRHAAEHGAPGEFRDPPVGSAPGVPVAGAFRCAVAAVGVRARALGATGRGSRTPKDRLGASRLRKAARSRGTPDARRRRRATRRSPCAVTRGQGARRASPREHRHGHQPGGAARAVDERPATSPRRCAPAPTSCRSAAVRSCTSKDRRASSRRSLRHTGIASRRRRCPTRCVTQKPPRSPSSSRAPIGPCRSASSTTASGCPRTGAPGSHGLRTMHARAEAIGATVAFSTPSAGGTRVELSVPLATPAGDDSQ